MEILVKMDLADQTKEEAIVEIDDSHTNHSVMGIKKKIIQNW
jgi:hypothetical protein